MSQMVRETSGSRLCFLCWYNKRRPFYLESQALRHPAFNREKPSALQLEWRLTAFSAGETQQSQSPAVGHTAKKNATEQSFLWPRSKSDPLSYFLEFCMPKWGPYLPSLSPQLIYFHFMFPYSWTELSPSWKVACVMEKLTPAKVECSDPSEAFIITLLHEEQTSLCPPFITC